MRRQIDVDIRVGWPPIVDDRVFFDSQIRAAPRKVGEQLCELIVSAQMASEYLSGEWWIH